MKTMKAKRVIAAALASLCTPIVLAGNSYITNDWGEIDRLNTATIMLDRQGNMTKHGFMAGINFSVSGRKLVSFTHIDRGADTCNASGDEEKFLIQVNGQTIKAQSWCTSAPDFDYNFLLFTAETEKGGQFIIDAFLNSPKEVLLRYRDIEFGISAVGFRKSWNSVSEDAL